MIKCGIVGCGNIAEDLHIPALKSLEEVEVIAACDKDDIKLSQFGKNYNIRKLFNDFNELIESGIELDFILIATPSFTHYELCRNALEAGYNLLVEKPVATSINDILMLRKIALEKNLKVCVIQNYRYRDVVLQAKKDFDRGRVGDIHQVNVTFHGQAVFGEPAPWTWEERKNKTLLYDLCIHYLDLQVFFAGRVKKIIATKSSWDKDLQCTEKIYAMVEHEGGATGIIDLQFNASSNYTYFELFGSANDIKIKFFPEYYRIYSGNINPIDEVVLDCKRIMNVALPTLKEIIVKPPVKRRAKSHYRLFKRFIDSLNNHSDVPVSLDNVIPTMEFIEELSKIVYE